ncbi:hypothetical protein [Nitrosomonas ureae]|uniref:3'-phosphoadenosine 5'-phosphosulfate sulfotransferase (PAPS reductase)/FAD synthetase n=1 Tax=Nitrosomonas ureae TaxID=44577 RepID=A0A2T5ISS2_9PROT|nr:hypothetical protein [Nitrosomonas ureae]PTQ86889.1 hypothetical protein C8R28_100884 [Nitrosomonas ureae]
MGNQQEESRGVKKLTVLSLGAGVQSSTLALMAAHGEIDMPDCAIFADTQSEPQSVYKWLDWLEKQLPFQVYKVSKGNLGESALKIHKSKKGNYYQKSAPPAWITEGDGKVNLLMRQCTVDFKIDPIRKKLRDLGGKKSGVEQLIGISLDEAHRMKPSRDGWVRNRWPLVEKGMKRHDCVAWMKRKGYPTPPRSSCSFCPYHSNEEWRRLKREEPNAFDDAVRWEVKFQKTMSNVIGFRGKPFLHRSCVPLSEIDFDAPSPQIDMFGNDCEGVCGV